MSISTTAGLVSQAYREGVRDAAAIIDREITRIMKRAEKFHDDDQYDLYEAHVEEANHLSVLALRIRRAARRGTP